jgi:hypothetical protein
VRVFKKAQIVTVHSILIIDNLYSVGAYGLWYRHSPYLDIKLEIHFDAICNQFGFFLVFEGAGDHLIGAVLFDFSRGIGGP